MRRVWLTCGLVFLACGGREDPVYPAPPRPDDSPPPTVATGSPAATESDAGDASVVAEQVEDSGVDAPAEAAAPPPRKVVNIKLPGKCVDTELHAAKEMTKLNPKSDIEQWKEFVSAAEVDLDGDGELDEIRFGGATNMTSRSFLYVKRGKCGHFVGMIETVARLSPLTELHKGLVDLGGTAGCQVDCCTSLESEEWRFDGARYRRAKKTTVKNECKGPSF